jgi:hypothetical protein
VEGPHALLRVTPVAAPPGWQGCSIDEGLVSGSVLFDAPTGKITLRGSGRDLWYSADECYFLCRPLAGDFRITVTALTRPTGEQPWAKAGVMLRESLEGGARDAYLVITPGRGLAFQWRAATGDLTNTGLPLPSVSQKMPITLRLTRQGDTVWAEYAQDPGERFESAGDRLVFTPALARRLYAGLVITSHQSGNLSEATFSGLTIQNR